MVQYPLRILFVCLFLKQTLRDGRRDLRELEVPPCSSRPQAAVHRYPSVRGSLSWPGLLEEVADSRARVGKYQRSLELPVVPESKAVLD